MGKHERIGVFGGTFDPIHAKHLEIARAALQQAQLDRVLFVVAARPPHKRMAITADPEDRFAMVAAAVEGEPAFEASRVELDREGPSYTADTLAELHRLHPGAQFWMIIGLDSLVDLPKWRSPESILSQARPLVVPRPGKFTVPKQLEGKFDWLDLPETDISSTEARRRIQAGEALDDLLPDSVRRVIEQRGIYRAHSVHRKG
ncbi:MAG: nicotinate-nucleotide adenylyltransferase [Candidatus Hydrogenedentes bacterium]|nr:nicotinate-nucleotide adenylyltransferase [Candidatus Hydrogenedentota bacterium]